MDFHVFYIFWILFMQAAAIIVILLRKRAPILLLLMTLRGRGERPSLTPSGQQ